MNNTTEQIQRIYFGRLLFSPEIMVEILEYSNNRFTNTMLIQINNTVSHRTYNKLETLWTNRKQGDTFGDMLRRTIYDPENDIKGFASCECCERHQTHRPSILEVYWEREFFDDWVPSDHTQDEQFRKRIECRCPCRHRTRWVCRALMPESDPFVDEII